MGSAKNSIDSKKTEISAIEARKEKISKDLELGSNQQNSNNSKAQHAQKEFAMHKA